MNTIERPSHFVLTVAGGGTTGEAAAGFLNAVEAGRIPEIQSADANAVITTTDNGSWTEKLRRHDPTHPMHAAGDVRRSVSALSANREAAAVAEHRLGPEADLYVVEQTGDALLEALSSSHTKVSSDRAAQIMDQSYKLAREIAREHGSLRGLTIGHLVFASLMREHREEGNGKNAQTAVDEGAALMASRGRIIIDSLVPSELIMHDGSKYIHGQSAVDAHIVQDPDKLQLWVAPSDSLSAITVPVNPLLLDAVRSANAIASIPGSHYGSRIAPWLSHDTAEGDGIAKAMKEGEAKGQPLVFIANLDKQNPADRTMNGNRALREFERFAGRKCTRVVLNHNMSVFPEDQALVFARDQLSQAGDYRIVSADLVGKTGVLPDPNNPIQKRAAVTTAMETALIAAVVENPEVALAMAAA